MENWVQYSHKRTEVANAEWTVPPVNIQFPHMLSQSFPTPRLIDPSALELDYSTLKDVHRCTATLQPPHIFAGLRPSQSPCASN